MGKELVLIPLFNEEAYIRSLLRELRSCFWGDVLFVDDGSTDGSAGVLSSLRSNSVHVLSHPSNQGYGQSLIDGFAWGIRGAYEYVVTMDCDWQHDPGYALCLFEAVRGVDIASGSRYLEELSGQDCAPMDRFRINKEITALINSITGFNLTDAFCGFKAYRLEALKRFALSEPGYGMPLQLWVQAHFLNLKVKEVGVPRRYPHLGRTFGNFLDDPEKRLKYYQETIQREKERWLSAGNPYS